MSQYIDPFTKENVALFSDFFERLDKKMLENLLICEEYKRLNRENEKIIKQYPSLAEIIESSKAINDVYSKEEMQALVNYIQNQHMINNYEKYEFYKVGSYECLVWLKMINII